MANYYLATDCETGGLDCKTSDILTIYLALFNEEFKLLEELDLKVKPDNGRLPLASAEALDVNKIDLKKHLADLETITYSEAKKKIVLMIKKYLKKTGRHSNIRPLGYNLSFDIGFIKEHILPQNEWESYINYNNIDPKVVINFLKDARWMPPELGTLISVVKHFNISMGVAHTAKADTLATVEVYKKLLELMESKKEGGQSLDLISLLESE